jgi:hypothetical protein
MSLTKKERSRQDDQVNPGKSGMAAEASNAGKPCGRRAGGASRGLLALLSGLLLVLLLLAPRRAEAWIETTVLSDDIRVQVERNGSARIAHALLLRVRGSPMRVFTLPGIDTDAAPEGDAQAVPVREGAAPSLEGAVPLTMVMLPDGGIRLEADGTGSIAKGNYLLRFRYRTDLIKSGALERDGAMVRMRWLGPRFPNGIGSAKVTLVIPASPGEPRASGDRRDGELGLDSDPALSGGAFLTTTRRLADRDEIELVRPHLARGEQVAWTVRLDPRALGAVNDPRIRPPPSAAVAAAVREPSRERHVFLAVATGLCVLFTALTAIKGRQVELHARAAQVVPRPLVRLPINVRAVLAGPCVALGVGLQLLCDPPVWGTFFLLLAMVLMSHRTPLQRPVARGPGRWLPISDDDAFRAAPRPRDAWLDISTRSGKIAFVLFAAALSAAGYAAHLASPFHATLLGIDSMLLLALFFTGRASELPPSLALGPVAVLRKAATRLRKRAAPRGKRAGKGAGKGAGGGDDRGGLRVVPWARFPQGSADHDELRLLVMPRTPARGLNSIEIGCAFQASEGSVVTCPEVLVRVAEESEAADRARALAPFGRWVRGRRAGELVLSVEPRLGNWKVAAELAHSLAVALGEEPKKAPTSAPTSAASSAGRGERVENEGTEGSPFQVTDAAWSA